MAPSNSRLIKRARWLRDIALVALVLMAISPAIILGAGTAAAHGNPEVKVEPNPADFGGEVTITGEGFEEEEEISLVLEGALGEIALGTATTSSEGMFSFTVKLPSTAAAGSYRVRAVGSDDVAVADLRIQQAEDGAAPAAAHEAAVDFHRVSPAGEVVGFAALAAVLALLGGILLWLPTGEKQV